MLVCLRAPSCPQTRTMSDDEDFSDFGAPPAKVPTGTLAADPSLSDDDDFNFTTDLPSTTAAIAALGGGDDDEDDDFRC